MAKRLSFIVGAIAGILGSLLGFRFWRRKASIRPRVMFADTDLIAANLEPPFPDHEGTFEDPGICIGDSSAPPPQPPANVACPGSFVIYSSWAEVVGNCLGFNGPGAGNNAVVMRARQEANAFANRIPCAEGCAKSVAEIWKGWDCGGNPTPIVAIAAVEFQITCTVTN